MSIRKKHLFQILICSAFLYACAYIVTPMPDVTPTSISAKGWTAVVTNVATTSAGDLHIDITIRNETATWSSMQSEAGHPAILTNSAGKRTDCDTVFVGTGGTSLAPGFQMRGYTGGTKADPKTQLIFVECKGATASPGSNLSIGYTYVTGPYNYYVAGKPVSAKFELNLDEVTADLKYPIAEPVQDLIEKPDASIVAINDCVLTLTEIQRTDTGLKLSWNTNNPGTYPTYVHIGIPPVIGTDGILYGLYSDPTLADAPITLPGQHADWTTEVNVPKDITGFYILVSVETKQQKNFVSHAIDISGK
jgi:hypothetical protein